MVSRDKYYERKAAGLCTKCGKSREGSPSQARCLACHTKLKAKQDTKKEEDKKTAQDKIETLKGNKSILSNITFTPKICGLCGETVNSLNLFCQKCVKITTFTKTDAISRYGSVCCNCSESDVKKLKVVSSDLSAAMKFKDKELYKRICYRRMAPPEYKVQCYACYWSDNNVYVKGLKKIFETQGALEEILDDDDVIDV